MNCVKMTFLNFTHVIAVFPGFLGQTPQSAWEFPDESGNDIFK